MNTQNIHDLIAEVSTLKKDSDDYVARNLLCCVLEIAKCDGSSINGTRSGYFWEKMDKALKEIGYEAIPKKN
jgi:hypothetical protein